MRITNRQAVIGVAAALLLVGALGACNGDEGSATSSATQDVETVTTSESTDSGTTKDGGGASGDVAADCSAANLTTTHVAMGEKVGCEGWIVAVTDFQESVAPPAGVELEYNQASGGKVDPSVSLAAATIEISAIGDGVATTYLDFISELTVGGMVGTGGESIKPLVEIAPGTATIGGQSEPLPVACLVDGNAPCVGTVYFAVEEDVDLSGELFVKLDSPSEESMGYVQVK